MILKEQIQTITILLIEDNPADVRLIKELLKEIKSFKNNLLTSASLKEGVTHIKKNETDVILLDLNLPDSLGRNSFKTICKECQHIPVVLVSGIDDVELALLLVKAGAQDFITKQSLNSALLEKTILYSIERKKSEEIIREQEEKYRSLIESSHDVIWTLDTQGNVIFVNKRAEEILGHTVSEIMGKKCPFQIIKEDLPKVREAASQTLQGMLSTFDVRIYDKDNQILNLSINQSPIYQGGSITGIVAFGHDVTEQIKADKELIELTAHQINVREEERAIIARELHDELGQQLISIKMATVLLNKHLELDENLKQVTDLLTLIDNTINSVRKISFLLHPKMLDDLGLFSTMKMTLKEFSRLSGIKFTYQIDLTEPVFQDNVAIHIFRIFQESLNNIIKHSSATEVNVFLKKESKSLLLTIKDNGKGFDTEQENKKKSFGHISMKERSKIINGDVLILSQPGKGTIIELCLPID